MYVIKFSLKSLENKKTKLHAWFNTGVAGFEPTHNRVKVCCLTAWRYPNEKWREEDSNLWTRRNGFTVRCVWPLRYPSLYGPRQNRTADTLSFNQVLYQLSYQTKWETVRTGFEPAIFCVTGRHVNPYTTEPIQFFSLNFINRLVIAETGFEPVTSGLWARRAASCSTPRYQQGG